MTTPADHTETGTFIPYEPPEPMYQDTMLAFKAFSAPQMAALIEPDPLGPVNKIVSLIAGVRRVKSVLCRVPAEARVEVSYESGGWTIDEVFALRQRIWDSRGTGEKPELPPSRVPGWYISIDDRVVLHATEAEVNPPSTWTPPRIPLWQRMRRALTEQLRTDADALAKRLGYHREDDCYS